MGLTRLATVTASTKRRPAISGGLIGVPVTSISSLKCTPLQPISPDVAKRQALNTPHEVAQTFVIGSPDIKEGDILVIGSREYPIKAVENWSNASTGKGAHLLLVVEDLKR
jgi:hypothetical protein